MSPNPVILDTNIYISYLLSLKPAGVVVELIHSVFEGTVVPAIAPEQIRELSNSVRSKPYLRKRISDQVLDAFVYRLVKLGLELEPLVGDIPRVFRDPKDDYLYAYAIRDGLGIIVSGDRDVLAEKDRFKQPLILTPQEFRDSIKRRELNQS